MRVTFTRTGKKRYRVSVEGPGVVPSYMEPAPGYDPRLPHDMAHFVVENEMGIMGGVFGQLAAGGNAGTFRPVEQPMNRKAASRGKRLLSSNRDDSLLSERIVDLAGRTWTGDHPEDSVPVKGVTEDDVDRLCRLFDKASAEWSRLRVGESMTLDWTAGRK